MLIVPFPAPTLAPAIPDTAKTLFIVPDELAPVVLPDADSEIVENKFGELFEIVTVNDPTPVAVASEIPAPAASANDTPVPVTEFAPALRDCVPAAPPAPAERVIELPLAVPDSPPVREICSVLPIVNVLLPAVFPAMFPLIVE